MGTCKMLIGMGGILPFSGFVLLFSCFVSIDFSVLI